MHSTVKKNTLSTSNNNKINLPTKKNGPNLSPSKEHSVLKAVFAFSITTLDIARKIYMLEGEVIL